MFGAEIPLGFRHFLRHQRMVVIGATDDGDRIWSTVLSGPAGFVDPVDSRTIDIGTLPAPGDPLRDAFDQPREIGMIAIEPQSRRRIRVNGRAHRRGSGLVLTTDQVLGNCPRYIQTRDVDTEHVQPVAADGRVHRGIELTSGQQDLIRTADTFFIASHAPEHGGDASHRGGQPGFVRVLGPRRLAWPDYVGNSFYMTLGNLQLNPRCGLLFLDWQNGHTLHLTGRARVDWNPERAGRIPGARRIIEFDIERTVQVEGANPLRWALHQYSRFNPPVGAWTGGED